MEPSWRTSYTSWIGSSSFHSLAAGVQWSSKTGSRPGLFMPRSGRSPGIGLTWSSVASVTKGRSHEFGQGIALEATENTALGKPFLWRQLVYWLTGLLQTFFFVNDRLGCELYSLITLFSGASWLL